MRHISPTIRALLRPFLHTIGRSIAIAHSTPPADSTRIYKFPIGRWGGASKPTVHIGKGVVRQGNTTLELIESRFFCHSVSYLAVPPRER